MVDLIDQYKMLHEAGKFPGFSVLKHADQIEELCRQHEAKTLLDYGSGKGEQYRVHHLDQRWDVGVRCYDPGYPPFEDFPTGKFDGVICTDVLEHVEKPDVPFILGRIFSKAKDFVFLSVCTRPAKKTLPDGRNCHLTVEDEVWWLAKIDEVNPGIHCETVFSD